MLASVGAIALLGLDPRPVRAEVATGRGLPGTRLIGLPDTSVREAADRVRSAVQRSGFSWPEERILVNLAPAELPKNGAGFDLSIALALLGASGQLDPGHLVGVWAFGELGLDGRARPVPGVLPVAQAVRRLGGSVLVVPAGAAAEAALVDGLRVIPCDDLASLVEVLRGDAPADPVRPSEIRTVADPLDLRDVRGQPVARRALEIAAAGGHHLLLSGPPGCGKSLLARRLPSILPPLSLEDALEVAAIHSIAGARRPDDAVSLTPPFREPHHTTSVAGLVGGGSGIPRPGEVSLAHHGALFVDELLEVPRWVLDALRQPLENGHVTLVRARASVRYPAEVLMIAATNPCPCGHLGATRRACRCRPDQVQRYRNRLSGPLLDRLDLQVTMTPVERADLASSPDGEDSATVAARVAEARGVAAERWGPGSLVRSATPLQVRQTCEPAAIASLARAIDALGLSARAFDRCLRVGRTIADLAGVERVATEHVDEAVAYRLPDLETVS